jgi:hypothetical protein
MLVPIRAESSLTSCVVTAEGRREEEGRRRREVKGRREGEGGREIFSVWRSFEQEV